MPRRRRAGKVVDLVDLEPQRLDDVVAEELEVGLREEMGDVGLLAREEVVDADHVVALGDQPLAEVAAEEAGASSDEDPLEGRHGVGSRGRESGTGPG